jgi:hypothetical protein
MGRKYGVSFSWKRATGISAAKSRISRMTGIPTTRQGRQRKFGAASGCCLPMYIFGIPLLIVITHCLT